MAEPSVKKGPHCLASRNNHETRSVDYMEQIYEQLIYLNRKMEQFLTFFWYLIAGGFLFAAIYLLLRIGKIL